MKSKNLALKLSLALVNLRRSASLQELKGVLNNWTELGKFNQLIFRTFQPIDQDRMVKEYALQYENATLNVQLVENRNTGAHTIQNFSLR